VPDGRTGKIISGHGRAETLRAMEARGDDPPDGVALDHDGAWLVPTAVGWSSRSDIEANAALIALNRSTEAGGWVDDELLAMLDQLATVDGGMVGVGFTDPDIDELRARLAEIAGESDTSHHATTVGEVISLVDVSWGEPRHRAHHGEVWHLGPHLLVVARVSDEHDRWSHLLTPERVFCPYPEPYLLFSTRALESSIVLVQPSTYLAGHQIDKWASVHGEESAWCEESTRSDDDTEEDPDDTDPENADIDPTDPSLVTITLGELDDDEDYGDLTLDTSAAIEEVLGRGE
jgi:hypothetical protein